MSDEDYDSTDEFVDEAPQQPERDNRDLAQLRKKAKDADKYLAELSVLRREAAFDKARLPDDVPGISFFRENYKGDLSPEAIKEAAAQHGFIQPAVDDTTARDAQQRMSASAAGVASTPQTDWQAGMREAAEKAPRGQEAQAIADFMRSVGRSVVG